jgi:hypothetical protein
MRVSKLKKLQLVPLALLLAPLASASPLFGVFGFTGPGVLVFNSMGADFIEFCNTVSGTTCSNTVSATGDINVTGPGSSSFSVLTAGQAGTIDNTTDATPPATPYTFLPVGVPVTVNDYITLSGENWNFQANELPLASCVTTSDQECIGPFQLDQNGQNVSVTANILGTLINVSGGGSSSFDLILSGQYTDTTIAAVIAGATSSAGVFSNSWSGSFTASPISATPEPMTFALLGGGLLLVGLVNRKRPGTKS